MEILAIAFGIPLIFALGGIGLHLGFFLSDMAIEKMGEIILKKKQEKTQ